MMKGVFFLPTLILCVLFLSCASKTQELLIDSFEGELDHKSVDYGAAQGSSALVEPAKDVKVCGEQSLKLTYELKPQGYMWVARGQNLDVKSAAKWLVEPKDIDWEKYNALSVYVYGANNGGIIAFDIKDAGGEMWRFIIADDFSGWKEISCPFSAFFVRQDWQPQTAVTNKTLDFPLMSFQFEPRLPGKGVYYFDCVKLVKLRQKPN